MDGETLARYRSGLVERARQAEQRARALRALLDRLRARRTEGRYPELEQELAATDEHIDLMRQALSRLDPGDAAERPAH